MAGDVFIPAVHQYEALKGGDAPSTARGEFLAGATAGAAALLMMLAGRFLLNVPTLPELIATKSLDFVPLTLFELVLSIFGSLAKRLLLLTVMLAMVGVAGVLAQWLARSRERRGQLRPAMKVAAALWMLTLLVILPFTGAGVAGWALPAGALPVALVELLSFVTYALALVWVRPLALALAAPRLQPAVAGTGQDRRRALAALAYATAGVAALGGVALWLRSGAKSGTTATPAGQPDASALASPFDVVTRVTPEITPNEKFYTVSKNMLADPSVDVRSWRLDIRGLVERPFSLRHDELKALPAVEQYNTLECISNEVGGDLIGNAHWKGVRLRDLLERSGIKPNARKVVFHAADGYTDSIPLEKALEPGTVLAYEMNGEVLPRAHGYPARLLVPGIYGMKNVKWVTAIEVVDYDFKGFWQKQGWSDEAVYKTMSRIDVPRNGQQLAPGAYLGGIAFAGDRGITAVEVSLDDGQTWQPARVKEALGPFTWVLWVFQAPPDVSSPRKVKVRATDGRGLRQTSHYVPPAPDGAEGLHTIVVQFGGR
jgi:DMSO/TMAO reductase YedYZ molybdopterin-dependent catalytic subunit